MADLLSLEHAHLCVTYGVSLGPPPILGMVCVLACFRLFVCVRVFVFLWVGGWVDWLIGWLVGWLVL